MVRHPMTMSVQLLMLRNPQTAFTLLSFIFTSNPDPIDTPYINSVIAELDFLELCNSHKKTRTTSPITRDTIQAIRECHSRFGHMSPRAMAATIASQSRADLPHFSADQVIKVMERWPCIFALPSCIHETTFRAHRFRRETQYYRFNLEHWQQRWIHSVPQVGIYRLSYLRRPL